MSSNNEIQVVIQVATAQGKAKIKDFTNTGEKEFKGLKGSAKKYLGSLGVAGLIATASGAVVAGVNRMVEKGKEFEQQQADLQAITGISGDRLDYLGQKALDTSVEFGESASNIIESQKLVASQLAQKIDFGTQAGTKQLEEISKQAVVLQKAAGSDLNTAVQTLTGTINQFNLSADDSKKLINEIAAGSKYGAAELGDQAAAYRDSGTAASAANRSFAELNASVQILAQNALRGSRAGTGLRAIFTRLQTRSSKLAKYGLNNVNVKTDSWATTLQKLKPLLQSSSQLVNVFGEEHANTARILIQNADAVAEMTNKVEGTNTAYKQAKVQLDTFKGAQSQLSYAINKELISAFQETKGAGVELLHTLTDIVTATGYAVRAINTVVSRSQRLENIGQVENSKLTNILNTGYGNQVLSDQFSGLTGIDLTNAQATLSKWQETTRKTTSYVKELANGIKGLEDVQNTVKKGSRAWQGYQTTIRANRKELEGIQADLTDQKKALQAQMQAVGKGGDEYAYWGELLREVQTRLDAANSAMSDTSDVVTTQTAQNKKFTKTLDYMSNALSGSLYPAISKTSTAHKSLGDQIDGLKKKYDTLIGQAGPLSEADKQELVQINRKINRLEALKKQRQAEIKLRNRQAQFGNTQKLHYQTTFSATGPETKKTGSLGDIDQEALKKDAEGFKKVSDAAEDAGDKGEQKMKALSASVDMVGNAFAQAIFRGESLGGVLASLTAQLASRALITGLKLVTGVLSGGSSAIIGSILGFAGGGKVRGPGSTHSDSIPAMLSDQEYVVNAASANAMPQLLEAANKDTSAAADMNHIYKNINNESKVHSGPSFEHRKAYAGGGKVRGPGSTHSDSIPAMLSDQEYVVNAASANAMPQLLEAANKSPRAAARANHIYKSSMKHQYAEGGRVHSGAQLPAERYPSLQTIDHIIQINRSDTTSQKGFDKLAEKIQQQTERLENVERKVDFKISEFVDAKNRFDQKEKEVGRG